MTRCFTLFLSLAIPFAVLLKKETATVRITGIFSDMAYIQEGGDVVGTEVIITRSSGGYVAKFQEAEGVPSDPVTVPVTVKGRSITFTVPGNSNDKPRIFHGVISAKSLRGRFEGEIEDRLLPRKRRSYWDR